MNHKLLTVSCISSFSLALLASCTDSTSAQNEFFNIGNEENTSSSSIFQSNPQSGTSEVPTSSASDILEPSLNDSIPNFSGSSASIENPASSGAVANSSNSTPITSESSASVEIPTSSATATSSNSIIPSSSSNTMGQVIENSPSTDRPVIAYTASGASVTNAGNCVTAKGGTITISCGGEYDFSGNYSGNDAQILVNTAKTDTSVYLNMKGLSLTNTADAPIYIQKASKAFVVAKSGTTNTFTDASTRTQKHTYTTDAGVTKEDTTGACIYSKDDLTIKGEGTLIVKANYNNGIHTSNDLKVKNGIITVNAKNNSLKGKGSVNISGGTLDITSTNGDGIKSDADEAADLLKGKGSIEITGGKITISSAFDGITANNIVSIANGESTPSIKITAGGGQNCLGKNTSSTTGGRGGFPGGFPGGMMNGGNSCSSDSSMKGIKADSSIFISGGLIDINSRDDGVHSDGIITISGGTTTIATDDDGVHADKALYVKDQANISVTMAYEGMESPDMNFEGGITSVITTDDGWNAAGGTSTGVTQGGFSGFGGSSSTGNLKVTGGYHYIYVGTGDTDGIDSNGKITISGGVIIVECRMNGGMGGMIDSDGTTTISGVKLLGFGTNNSEEGTPYNVSFTSANYYGTSEIAFKPSFSGSKMVSSVGQPGIVNSVSGMTKTCFGNSTDKCVYTK